MLFQLLLNKRFHFFQIFFLLLLPAGVIGQTDQLFAGNKYVKASLYLDVKNLQPPQDPARPVARLGVYFQISPGWHIYGKESGDAGIPTSINFELPDGWRTSEISWPPPSEFVERGNIRTLGYSDETLLTAKLFAPAIIPKDGQTVKITAHVSWLACQDICVPGRQKLELEVPFSGASLLQPSKEFEFFERFENSPKAEKPISQKSDADFSSLIIAIISAFIGGMFLNLMPCVLPIISIKVMGFVKQKEHSPKAAVLASLYFTTGILATFLLLALTVISLRSLGYSLGWGFQFQHPQFVAGLSLVVFLLSLAFFDLYSIEVPFMQQANRATAEIKGHFWKHFFDGVLATALSTPCTAPFLGTALVFAFSQSAIFSILVFLAIGLGLALPYVYLSTHPALLKLLPAPGDWMFRFRQLMGFFLLGTVAWLLFVMHRLTEDGDIWLMVLLLFVFFSTWWRKVLKESSLSDVKKRIGAWVLMILVVYSGVVLYPKIIYKSETQGSTLSKLIDWQVFSEELLQQGPKRGQTLFVDFTASWCITCKANEYLVIETPIIAEAIKKYRITPVKADWTTGDEKITAALRSFGAEGVPLYVVIPPGGRAPIVLPTLLTSSALIEAFKTTGSNNS